MMTIDEVLAKVRQSISEFDLAKIKEGHETNDDTLVEPFLKQQQTITQNLLKEITESMSVQQMFDFMIFGGILGSLAFFVSEELEKKEKMS